MLTALSLMMLYVGIDVAKAKLDVVVLINGKPLAQTFANTPSGFEALLAWLAQFGAAQIHACLEATGSYSDAIARFLWLQGFTVSVLNPAVLVDYRKAKNLRRKNDRLDAQLLAQYGAEMQPAAWAPVPDAVLLLRQWLAYRRALKKMSQQTSNRLEAGRMSPWIKLCSHEQVRVLELRISEAEMRLMALVNQSADLLTPFCLLTSIPGIGWVVAVHLIAQIGDIHRFRSASSLVSLAGLGVTEHRSGSWVNRPGHIDRHGHALLRGLLYWSAVTAIRTDPAMAAWAQRMRTSGKSDMVIITAVMRKLLHIAFGVWKHGTPYDPALILAQAMVA
jgi:transposase